MSTNFHNSTGLAGAALTAARGRAQTQDEKLLAFFRAHPGQAYTRDEVHELVLPAAQNTSVTRALNTLMKAGHIEKRDEMRAGRMGAQQHLWQYAPREPRQEQLL